MKRKINNLKNRMSKVDILYYRNFVSTLSLQENWNLIKETDYLRDYSGSLEERLYLHDNIGVPYEITCTRKACRRYGGQLEVEIPQVGRIDLLTRFEGVEYMIESKVLSAWKHALGQILSYHTKYHNGRHCYTPAIALLKQNHSKVSMQIVKDVCNKFNVTLMNLSKEGILTLD